MADICKYKIISSEDTVEKPSLITIWAIAHYFNSLEIFTYFFSFFLLVLLNLKNIEKVDKVARISYITYITTILIFLGCKYKFKDNGQIKIYVLVSVLIFIPLYYLIQYYFNIPELFIMFLISLFITLAVHTYYEIKTAGSGAKDEWWTHWGTPDDTHILSNSVWNSIGDTLFCILACISGYFIYLKILNNNKTYDFKYFSVDASNNLTKILIFFIIAMIIVNVLNGLFSLIQNIMRDNDITVDLPKELDTVENRKKVKQFKGFQIL